mgnify:CR=1 FL=1
MRLFKIVNWEVQVEDEAWLLLPFKKLKDRDKTEDKIVATNEMAFIYFYADVKSDFRIVHENERADEIKKTLPLPKDWEMDNDIIEAIKFYEEYSPTVIEKLYANTEQSAMDIGEYLKDTKKLLKERDNNGRPVYDVSKITSAIEKVPKLMSNLKSAYKELIAEQKDNEGRTKGSRSFNMFETGLIDGNSR